MGVRGGKCVGIGGCFQQQAFFPLLDDARTGAGLTQRELAERIGTKQSVVGRMEDADYEGHSLSMLKRIADAVGDRRVARSA
jgi:transcriptional regulator with XRE-family HTH domain